MRVRTFEMAEESVGLGAVLLAPNRRFMVVHGVWFAVRTGAG